MGLQSQLYTQAEDVMVLQVKPKEFCYWTEPRVFSPHTNQFPLNQGTEVIVLSSEKAQLQNDVKYHIQLQDFVLDTKIPGNKPMEQHQRLLCCPGTDRTNSSCSPWPSRNTRDSWWKHAPSSGEKPHFSPNLWLEPTWEGLDGLDTGDSLAQEQEVSQDHTGSRGNK